VDNHFPGCEAYQLRTDEYYQCYLQQYTLTDFHHSCTCKMGGDNNPMAVVDSQLRVKGVKGLRVADASVFPVITNANTNAPSMLVGEMAADLVANSWS